MLQHHQLAHAVLMSGLPHDPRGFTGPPAGPPAGWQGGAQMRPLPGGPPKKKSRVGLFIGCGCLSILGFVFGVGGFLLYQEEIRGLHVPDSEVASVPVEPGKPFTIEFVWDGTGYAFNNVWLVIEDGTKSGGKFEVQSQLACSRGSSEKTRTITLTGRDVHDLESEGGESFSAWMYLGDEYTRSSGRKISCTGTVKPVTGSWTRAHIAVTQRQRPADFFAF